MREDPDDPNEPGHEECMIFSTDGRTRLLFIEVPEGKQVKNRIHFDLRPPDATREEEVSRLIGLGATEVADHRRSDGSGWVTLADPEGNEFCVLRGDSQAEDPVRPPRDLTAQAPLTTAAAPSPQPRNPRAIPAG